MAATNDAATHNHQIACKVGYSKQDPTFLELIQRKRDNGKFSSRDLEIIVDTVVNGKAEDAQIGAMLMAIYLRGLDDKETAFLTKYMVSSGKKIDWGQEWNDLLVDKHSTGGVGDKISLALAPALAACGFKVPMMSGRGLGHTGGTLDKLESIPGFNISLSEDEMRSALKYPGCFIAGTTSDIAPADRVIYKQRDATGTIESLGLIVSSIVSKKVAEGTRSLVMDVKVGEGAFIKTTDEARKLAQSIVAVARLLGVQTRAVLTRMDAPIGRAVGNALEVAEAIDCMKGKGPQDLEDLVTLLGGVLLEIRKSVTPEEGRREMARVLHDGSALKAFEAMLVKQGVSAEQARSVCLDPWTALPSVPPGQTTVVKASRSGVVKAILGLKVGQAAGRLGGGRSKAGDAIDHRVGVMVDANLSVGATISRGDPMFVIHHASATAPQEIIDILTENTVVFASTEEKVAKENSRFIAYVE